MRKVCFAILGLFFAFKLVAQNNAGGVDVYELDTLFTTPTKSLPFDRDFILKVPFSKRVEATGYGIVKIPKRRVNDYKETTIAKTKILTNNHKVVPSADKQGCNVFLLVPPLDPGKYYDFKILYKPDSAIVDKYLDVFNELDQPIPDYPKALQLIKQINEWKAQNGDDFSYLLTKTEKRGYRNMGLTPDAISVSLFTKEIDNAESKTKMTRRLSKYFKREEKIKKELEYKAWKADNRGTVPFRSYIGVARKIPAGKSVYVSGGVNDSVYYAEVKILDAQIVNPIPFVTFYNQNKDAIHKYFVAKKAAAEDYEVADTLAQAICNNTNKALLPTFKKMLKGILNSACDPNWRSTECLRDTARCRDINLLSKSLCKLDTNILITMAASTGFCTMKKNYENAVKEFTSLRKQISDRIGTEFTSSISLRNSSTFIYDAKTRAKFSILPDFGWVYYGFQPGFNGVTGYAGIQVELRYTDKDVPFWLIRNKKLSHFVSFTFGFTYLSLTKKGQREDLIDKKSSIVMGMGIRLTNLVKFTTGGLLFYKVNPNPTINNRSLAFTPYIGLSLDLSLKELIGDIAGIKGLFQDIKGALKPNAQTVLDKSIKTAQ